MSVQTSFFMIQHIYTKNIALKEVLIYDAFFANE